MAAIEARTRMHQQHEIKRAILQLQQLHQRIRRHLAMPIVSAAPAAPEAPALHGSQPRLALPQTWFPQRGANCREVALGNVLRLPREPTARDMEPFLIAITRDQLPCQLSQLHANMRTGIDATEWTRGWAACASLMTYFIEAHWPGVIAVQAARVPWPGQVEKTDQRDVFVRAFGGTSLSTVQMRDRHSPGFVYFTATHCMSCLQDDRGQWWDVPQASAQRVSRDHATSLFQRAMGVVAILSIDAVCTLVRAHLTTAVDHCPLLLARMATRAVHPPPAQTRALVEAMTQTPIATWSPASRTALRAAVMAWWGGSGKQQAVSNA